MEFTFNMEELWIENGLDLRAEMFRMVAEAAASGKLVAIKVNGETVAFLDAAGIVPQGAGVSYGPFSPNTKSPGHF